MLEIWHPSTTVNSVFETLQSDLDNGANKSAERHYFDQGKTYGSPISCDVGSYRNSVSKHCMTLTNNVVPEVCVQVSTQYEANFIRFSIQRIVITARGKGLGAETATCSILQLTSFWSQLEFRFTSVRDQGYVLSIPTSTFPLHLLS